MPTISDRVPTERRGEWLEYQQTCGARGLSLKAHAEQAGLDSQRLYQLYRRLKLLGFVAGGQTISFAAVELKGGTDLLQQTKTLSLARRWLFVFTRGAFPGFPIARHKGARSMLYGTDVFSLAYVYTLQSDGLAVMWL